MKPRPRRRAAAAFLLNLFAAPAGYVFADAPRVAAWSVGLASLAAGVLMTATFAHPPGIYAVLYSRDGLRLNPSFIAAVWLVALALAVHAAWLARRRIPRRAWPRRLGAAVGLWALWLLVLLVYRAFGPFVTYQAASASMEPTLWPRDIVAFAGARGLCGHAKPVRGDVVVYRLGGAGSMKRVVALPGETVETRGAAVWVNGRPLTHRPAGTVSVLLAGGTASVPAAIEGEASGRTWRVALGSTPGIADAPPRVLAPGEVFVMGDNRGNSIDSRTDGPVAVKTICSVATKVLWSAAGTPLGVRP